MQGRLKQIAREISRCKGVSDVGTHGRKSKEYFHAVRALLEFKSQQNPKIHTVKI